MWANPRETADLVTFNKEILHGKLHFLCKVFCWFCFMYRNVLLTQICCKINFCFTEIDFVLLRSYVKALFLIVQRMNSFFTWNLTKLWIKFFTRFFFFFFFKKMGVQSKSWIFHHWRRLVEYEWIVQIICWISEASQY